MRCNEICVHCYRAIERRPELTTEEIKRVLKELAAAGTLYLTFSGGEIFLRRDLFELIEDAKRLRFDVRLKSNALLITRAKAERLRALGVRQVDVSVYSADPEVHDSVTKIKGSLEKSIRGLIWLRQAGVTVKLNCPLMKQNVGKYKEVRALAKSLGALSGFDPMITARTDGDRSPVSFRISATDLMAVLQDPIANPDLGSNGGTQASDLDEIPCGASHNACYISPYGDVSPCVALPIVCGNVRETPFEEIWRRSGNMLEVRSIRTRDLHTCSSCAASEFCSRCPGQALVEDGDLYGPSTAACEHALVAAQVAGSTAIPPPLVSRLY
jgi:radical SAM protein with 4Fe4S-binding SPASM domain